MPEGERFVSTTRDPACEIEASRPRPAGGFNVPLKVQVVARPQHAGRFEKAGG